MSSETTSHIKEAIVCQLQLVDIFVSKQDMDE